MKENKILISVLVPTYNRRLYLEECLNSVMGQEWFKKEEIEILIWDNSEWDETKEFMDSYLKKNRKFYIKYIKNKTNLWSTWNCNNLLDLSKWEYFIFMSDDDKFYDKNSLKSIYDWLLKYKLDACYWKYIDFNSDWSKSWEHEPHKKIKNKEIYIDSFDEQIIWHTIAFSWVLYKQFWYHYDEKSKWLWDRLMNLQYLYNNKKVWLINKYTYLYRIHDSNDWLSIPKFFWWKFIIHSFKYFNISYLKRVYYLLKIIVYWFIVRINLIFWKFYKNSCKD